VTTVSLKDLLSESGRRDPYAFYAQLHAQGRTASRLHPVSDGYDVLVYGYDEVERVLKDPTFKLMDIAYMDEHVAHWREHTALRTLKDSVFFVNAAIHTRLRHLFTRVFTPRRVTALEPAIGRLCTELLDDIERKAAGGREIDFMAEFAYPLPSNVIGELLGVPEHDRAWFRPRVLTLSMIFELDGSTWHTMRDADQATGELRDYFAELAAKRRVDPREDLVSGLVTTREADGDQLTEDELIANLITLFNAGFVTTTHLFGNGLRLLLEDPARRQAVLDDPAVIPSYVDEILRYEPPVHFVVRYTDHDTEIAGIPVARGESVVVALGAANRDPAVFADPDVFDPTRPHRQLMTFGYGPHICLGAALTRAEGQIALPILLDRFPDLRIVGEPSVPRQLMFRGHETLPVTIC
jgi:cytochrome P450